jgi:hypothetical protein
VARASTPLPSSMSTLTPAELAPKHRLSAIINGSLGVLCLLAGLGFAAAWLIVGFSTYQWIPLISLLTTGVSLGSSAALLLSIAIYHFFKWRASAPQ